MNNEADALIEKKRIAAGSNTLNHFWWASIDLEAITYGPLIRLGTKYLFWLNGNFSKIARGDLIVLPLCNRVKKGISLLSSTSSEPLLAAKKMHKWGNPFKLNIEVTRYIGDKTTINIWIILK
ncbi:hypothetical protein IFT92_16445 [Peribacillus simplex]|uniref:hypothetical protein n=1 Tax=Peribacillus simplex TaxID=1478 RepID=UPI00137A0E30|nr:hypothetical protein [Peribacillus simplex]MBD8589389.1 hypothetical protein [Peribacillus simplex]NCT39739.1 hypothetical protein [Peribacillus frigoritolerans]